MYQKFRKLNSKLIYPVLKITGFRFSKHYRWQSTMFYLIVNRLVDTVEANILADR